jgi:uncharacterized protein (UPF0276 family)
MTDTGDFLGYGLGLRKEHYAELLEGSPRVDWLEVLTENYLVPGGPPLFHLERIRACYPVVMHGVSLSIGSTTPLDLDYLRQVRALATRIEPRWISDHLCWTGTDGTNLHDLMPLPYSEESLRHVVERVSRVQDFLGTRILLENVSSYLEYTHSCMPEWEFIAAVAEQADCHLLLDINNIFVSARNHDFAPETYLNAMPPTRIRQFHLAGHRDHGDYIVDTHDEAIVDPVWALYRAAVRRFPPTATMIERDDDIPPLAELVAELELAREQAAAALAEDPVRQTLRVAAKSAHVLGPALHDLQRTLQAHVLEPALPLPACIAQSTRVNREQRVAIYSDGYRLRLIDAMRTEFPALAAVLGAEDYATLVIAYLEAYPSRHFSLRWIGERFSEFLAATPPYSKAPLLSALTHFEWTLGEAFDAPDAPVVDAAALGALPGEAWPDLRAIEHPSVRAVELGALVPGHWRAAKAGEVVSPEAAVGAPTAWRIWRQDLKTMFRSLPPLEAASIRWLTGTSFIELCDYLSGQLPEADVPSYAARLLASLVAEGSITRLDQAVDAAEPADARHCG